MILRRNRDDYQDPTQAITLVQLQCCNRCQLHTFDLRLRTTMVLRPQSCSNTLPPFKSRGKLKTFERQRLHRLRFDPAPTPAPTMQMAPTPAPKPDSIQRFRHQRIKILRNSLLDVSLRLLSSIPSLEQCLYLIWQQLNQNDERSFNNF